MVFKYIYFDYILYQLLGKYNTRKISLNKVYFNKRSCLGILIFNGLIRKDTLIINRSTNVIQLIRHQFYLFELLLRQFY